MTTETELVAGQQCEFAALMAAENFGTIWSWFVDSCSNESTAIGAVIAVVSVLIGFYRSFIRLNPESEKYKRKLEYYLNTHHPSDFDNVVVLSPEEKKAKRDAIALQKEIEAYCSRNRIRIYEFWLNRGLNKLQRFFGEAPVQPNTAGNSSRTYSNAANKSRFYLSNTLFAQLLSEGSYKFCLTLAFVYPLLFAFINGFMSNGVALAQFSLFKFESISDKVWFVAGATLAFVLIRLGQQLKGKTGWWWMAEMLCYICAVSLAGVLATVGVLSVAGAGVLSITSTGVLAIAGVFAVAGVGVFAVSGAGFSAGVFAVAGFGAVCFAVTVAGAGSGILAGVVALALLNYLQKNERLSALKRQGYFALISLLYLTTCCIVVAKFGEPNRIEFVLIPILLGILPLLNAPIDWLSLNFTRALSYLIADHHGKKRFLLGFLLADIVGAIVFMALIVAVMLGVLSVANYASYFLAEHPILDFNQIMPAMISADTASQYIWAHFMVLSTLIPTLLHLILVMVSVVLYPFGHAKKAMYDNFYQNQQHYAPIVMRHQQTQKAQAIVLGVVVLVIAAVAIMNFSWAGCGLWHYADWVLSIIDSGYVSPVGGDLLCF